MSKELKSSANTGAKEKGIEERTYDLRSKFSDDEYGFLLSRVFDKFEDLDNELYLKVISNRRILSDDIEQLQSIIRDYLKVTSINDRYLMGTAILQKLFDLLRSEPSKVTEAEPQEQECEVKKSSELAGAKEKGIEERTYDLESMFSDDEYGFLLSRVFDKLEDPHNEYYLKYIRDSEFSSSDIDQLQSLILDYLKVTPYKPGTISGYYYDMAKAIYHQLSEIVEEPQEQSDVTDTEPQEQEREVKKTSANNTGAEEKGIEERTYYYADLRSELSDDELDFLVGFILCKFEDTHNEFYLKYIRDSEFSSSDIDQLQSLILDYLKVTPYKPGTISGNRYDMAKAIYHKLSEIVEEPQEQSDVTDTEPQEQEREEPQEKNSAVFKVTLYFENGQTLSKIFKYHTSDFDIGFIFKLFQNSPEPPDSNFCIFNIFNFVDVRGKVVSIEVSCDISAMKKSTTSLQSRVRYDIIEVHSVEIDNFKFDNRDVVAFCQTIEEAERLVKALSALNEDKPHYRYEYELIAPYNSIFDEHFDIQNIPGVLNDTLPF